MAYMVIDELLCTGCGKCVDVCPTDGVYVEDGKAHINEDSCIVCCTCVKPCTTHAISRVSS